MRLERITLVVFWFALFCWTTTARSEPQQLSLENLTTIDEVSLTPLFLDTSFENVRRPAKTTQKKRKIRPKKKPKKKPKKGPTIAGLAKRMKKLESRVTKAKVPALRGKLTSFTKKFQKFTGPTNKKLTALQKSANNGKQVSTKNTLRVTKAEQALVNLTSALDLYKNETVAKLEMLDLRITNLTEQIYTNDVIIRNVLALLNTSTIELLSSSTTTTATTTTPSTSTTTTRQ